MTKSQSKIGNEKNQNLKPSFIEEKLADNIIVYKREGYLAHLARINGNSDLADQINRLTKKEDLRVGLGKHLIKCGVKLYE